MIYKIRTTPEKRKTRLKQLILESGMTQKEICDKAGIRQWQLSNLSTGKNNDCMLNTAKKICNILDINLHQAFGDLD